MDNLCHSLAGLCLGEAGLRRRTPLATATLLVGANLPDVDALAYLASPVTALAFRRGWTHGVLAMAVWPFVLAGLMLLVGRLTRRRPDATQLLIVAAAAVLSHPLLDLLNTYGVRLLMPFSGRWFYGDALFIIDPWVWAALLTGIIVSRRAASVVPARLAIVTCATYMVVMAALGAWGRRLIRYNAAHEGITVARVMVAPAPLTPLRRQTVLATGDGYLLGELFFLPLTSTRTTDLTMRNPAALERVAETAQARAYLTWARFPYASLGPFGDCPARSVCLRDARYPGQSWAEVVIALE